MKTHIIAFDKDGNAMWFEENYQDYHDYMINLMDENIINPKYRHKKLV